MYLYNRAIKSFISKVKSKIMNMTLSNQLWLYNTVLDRKIA